MVIMKIVMMIAKFTTDRCSLNMNKEDKILAWCDNGDATCLPNQNANDSMIFHKFKL